MGQRASDTRGVTFEDVVVPKEVTFNIKQSQFLYFLIFGKLIKFG